MATRTPIPEISGIAGRHLGCSMGGRVVDGQHVAIRFQTHCTSELHSGKTRLVTVAALGYTMYVRIYPQTTPSKLQASSFNVSTHTTRSPHSHPLNSKVLMVPKFKYSNIHPQKARLYSSLTVREARPLTPQILPRLHIQHLLLQLPLLFPLGQIFSIVLRRSPKAMWSNQGRLWRHRDSSNLPSKDASRIWIWNHDADSQAGMEFRGIVQRADVQCE